MPLPGRCVYSLPLNHKAPHAFKWCTAGCLPRDTLPPGRVVYRLLLTYKLAVGEAGKYTTTVPSLNK